MKGFIEFCNEGLKYKRDNLDMIRDIDSYGKVKPKCKCSINPNCCLTTYTKNNKPIFSYNSSTKELIVLKQAWQMMNLERGF